MIMIDTPPDGSSFPAGTPITLQGTNGLPNRCTVTCGSNVNNYTTGTVPGQLPLVEMPGGAWSLMLTLPNDTGSCTIFVLSQSDKSAGVTYTLTAREPGPTPGGAVPPVPPVPVPTPPGPTPPTPLA